MHQPYRTGLAERVLHRARTAGSGWADKHGLGARACYEFLVFGIKQGWACLFGGLLLLLILLSSRYYPADAPLTRYDFLVVSAVGLQVVLLATKMETWEEAKVIAIFHVVGTAMEIFKVHVGSWQYPEESVLRIAEVPLFTGFMYAAIGSFIARVWRLFDFRYSRYPNRTLTFILATLIYANFFSHHYLPDLRWGLFVAFAVLYRSTWVYFRVDRTHRSMPLLVGFALVSLFIWFAENIGTYAQAWVYPSQKDAWEMVSLSKLSAWFLLMNISFVLITLVERPSPPPNKP